MEFVPREVLYEGLVEKNEEGSQQKNRHNWDQTLPTRDIICCKRGSSALSKPEGCIAVFQSFLILLYCEGVVFTFGEVMDQLEASGVSRVRASFFGSSLAAVPLLLGPFTGLLAEKVGARVVTVVGAVMAGAGFYMSAVTEDFYGRLGYYGGLTGGGLSLCYGGAAQLVTLHYAEECCIPHGVANSGGGVGAMVLAPLITHFNRAVGWQRTAVYFAYGFGAIALIGLFMRTPKKKGPPDHGDRGPSKARSSPVTRRGHAPERLEHSPPSTCQMFSPLIWRNKPFALFLVSNALLYLGYDIPFMFLEAMAKDHGVDPGKTATLLGTLGLFSTIGTILYGIVGAKNWMNISVLYGTSLVVCGAAAAAMSFVAGWSTPVLYVVCAVFGFTLGSNYGLSNKYLIDVAGVALFNTVHGIMMGAQGCGNMIGPPIAAYVLDRTSNYDAVFQGIGVLIIASGLVMLVASVYPAERIPSLGGGGRKDKAEWVEV